MAQLFSLANQVEINESGLPYAGAQLLFYQTGTLTPQNVYQDATLSTPHPQPILADDTGYFPPIWLNPNAVADYRYQLLSASGGVIRDIPRVSRGAVSAQQIGEALYPITTAEQAASVTVVNSTYPPGDVRRYGGIEGASITTALQAAINASDRVKIPLRSVSAAGVELRAGVEISGLGAHMTTLTRQGTGSIFTTTTAKTGCAIRDLCLDANSSYTNPVCNFVAGTSDFTAERLRAINFDSGSGACAIFQWQGHATTRNERILIRRCDFDNDGNPVTANYQTVLVYNGKGVQVLDCDFRACGAFAHASATTFTGLAGDILFSGNRVAGVDSSSVLIRLNGAATLENVNLIGNRFDDISPTLGKLCMTVQQQPATTGGAFRNINVLGNTARCPDVNCAGLFALSLLGSAECNNVLVASNSIDLTDEDGAVHTTGNATQRGIWIFGDTTNLATNIVVVSNTIRGAQSFGIGIGLARGFAISANAVELCVTNAASGAVAIESGIYVAQGATTDGVITGNNVKDCGGGGAGQAGIGTASSATIERVHIGSNNISDTRGSPAMVFGVNVGAAAANVTYGSNQISGATTSNYNAASPGVAAYTVTNYTEDRTFDANTAADAELSDVLATLIADLRDGKAITASIS